MPIYPVEAGGLARAVQALQAGQCVGMPTETVYGLAADALNPLAVARVFETKERPHFDPLIVHIGPEHDPEHWVSLSDTARILIAAFWPGPLTLLVKKGPDISDLVTSGHSTVALRCPAHPIAQALLRAFNGPLVAPSANPFGRISPTSAQAVQDGLGERLDVILEGGACEVGLESTIVDTTAPFPSLPILRLGGIEPERLAELGFELSYPTPIIGQAPGTLKNHYAPLKPLYLFDGELHHEQIPMGVGCIRWKSPLDRPFIEVLSTKGSSLEAASRLFSVMRTLDQSPTPWLIAELPPPEGLGAAIRDRLKRAASGFFDPENPPFI